jgi:hypothetical protein
MAAGPRTVQVVFHEAREFEGSARARYLDRACAGAPELRREVETLLATCAVAGDAQETTAPDPARAPMEA